MSGFPEDVAIIPFLPFTASADHWWQRFESKAPKGGLTEGSGSFSLLWEWGGFQNHNTSACEESLKVILCPERPCLVGV